MSNRKLIGSNIMSWEYTTGVCPTQCEQCFCNFGFQGKMVTASYMKESNRNWRNYAEKERQLRNITKSAATKNIPVVNATKSRIYKRRIDTVELKDFNVEATPILRVSSMSDCSYYPPEVIKHLVNTWEEYCFFNSSIKSIVRHPRNLKNYIHKVVITTNPGTQTYIPPRVENNNELVVNSILKPKTKYDFFNPHTLTDVNKADLEYKVKFYRLRSIQTIIPRINTDKPIVLTPIRFKSLISAAAWCTKYNIECEIYANLTKAELEILETLDVTIYSKRGNNNLFRIRSDNSKNISSNAGEWTNFIFKDSWWRQQFNLELREDSAIDNYICDRANLKCKGCGLCATLDGTKPNWHNDLNLINGKNVLAAKKESNYLYQMFGGI